MQKKYKAKVLSLGTWPTTGTGFQLALEAWRAFRAGLAPGMASEAPRAFFGYIRAVPEGFIASVAPTCES